MRRTYLEKLIHWKSKPDRKPLILKGVRQVGKTYLLQHFGNKYFPAVHYLNFEKDSQLVKIFEKNLDPKRIISEIELYLSRKINTKNDLVIFDEIQICPRALTSLKYFQEELPELALASAGSLLGIYLGPVSFPVGKVDTLTLYPMSFEEFLIAIDEKMAYDFLKQVTVGTSIPEILHDKLWEKLKLYFIVGGLPEAVATFCQNKDSLYEALEKVRSKQVDIINAYYADIAKHSGKENAMHIERVFRAIPIQLAQAQDGNAKKFSFKGVIPGADRYSRLAGPIDWLQACGLIVKVPICHSAQLPLLAYTKENAFKLYVFDVGILGAMSHLAPKVIYSYDYGSFKGYFAENFIAQELLYAGTQSLYSWHEKNSEIEFLQELDGAVIPVEVKSGWVTQAKSLKIFRERYHPPFSVIFSAKNLSVTDEKDLIRSPHYLANQLFKSWRRLY
jgi:predicted AAA+ superfamily ATPase